MFDTKQNPGRWSAEIALNEFWNGFDDGGDINIVGEHSKVES